MKTAMQELLGLVEQMFNNADALKLELPASMLNDIINIITQEGLQKEKEQIKRAFEFGLADAYNFIEDEAEQYYNQTYNTKQHIIDIMKADEDDGLYDLNK